MFGITESAEAVLKKYTQWKFLIPKIESQIKRVLIKLEELRNGQWDQHWSLKNIHEEKKLTWEGSARVLGQFACKKLNMNSTYEEIDIFISRVHKCRKYLSKNYHKGSKPLFSQFTNCRFEEEICTKIINLTSKRRLNVYVSQPISKELTETTNEALKHIK